MTVLECLFFVNIFCHLPNMIRNLTVAGTRLIQFSLRKEIAFLPRIMKVSVCVYKPVTLGGESTREKVA